jgi:DNA-binding beta-propeller fold protein YncE
MFSTYGIVKVGTTFQVSGTTANSFTRPVVYTVVMADGTTAAYTVAVKIAREIYVANNSNDTVSVYDSSFSGNMNALRQFGSLTSLSYPKGIAVDTVNNQIFVTNDGNNSITVYGWIDSGNIAPVRTISGASTGLSSPQAIAVDTVNNQIFVVNYGNNSITVYGRTDTGNVVPVSTISGLRTGLSRPSGIAVDTAITRSL